jgi:hypothetical protein
MKLSLFFDANIADGGSYHHCLKTIEIFKKIKIDNLNISLIVAHKKKEFINKKNLNILNYNIDIFDRLFFLLYSSNLFRILLKRFKVKNKFEKFLYKNKIDLVYFISNSRFSIFCNNINFCTYIYEIHHLFRPDLPEYKTWHDFDLRENVLINSIKKSSIIFVDTNKKKKDLVKYYNCYEEKIKVIPLISNLIIDKKKISKIANQKKRKLGLKKKYFFYPAQYWAHKNHKYLIDTMKILVQKHKFKDLFIFTGQKKGNFTYLNNLVLRNNLSKYIKFFDYLTNDDVINLYKNCEGLIMPTLIGNSCLPLYEAFYYRAKVFYTKNLLDNSLKKFVTEFNIDDPNDLVKKIINCNYQKLNFKRNLAYSYVIKNLNEQSIEKKYKNIFEKYIYQTNIYNDLD